MDKASGKAMGQDQGGQGVGDHECALVPTHRSHIDQSVLHATKKEIQILSLLPYVILKGKYPLAVCPSNFI